MNWIAITWAGFVATLLATSFFWLARSFGWTTFSPAIQVGCMVTRDPRRPLTETIGVIAILMVGTTAGALLIQLLMMPWTGPAWMGGLIFGGLIGVAVAAALPLIGMISACVRMRHIPEPGPFGIGWGRGTPVTVFCAHLVYGMVAASILAAF